MRIALHNPYFGNLVAETELAHRISLASANLGWQVREVATSTEINQFEPDLVISLHFRTPKLTKYPTYGCFWNPPEFFESDPQFIKNILSYDSYLSASNLLDQWLKDTYYHLPKPIEIIPFYPSCNATPYQTPNFEHSRLAYIGSNWDGSRFQDLFLALEQAGYLHAYGSPEGWAYLKTAYKGVIPFDGVSVLNILRQSGAGLCLHREEHNQAQVPSMRIFEIIASGAIALCAEHPFIRENFGDRVLYLKPNQSTAETVEQISDHLRWIQTNPDKARQMSVEAHDHFSKHFTLEQLLENLVPRHQALIQKQKLALATPIRLNRSQSDAPLVQLIIRVGNRGLATIQRALHSIAQQTYRDLGAIVVQYRDIEGLEQLLSNYRDLIHIQHIYSKDSLCRSTQLWAGINTVSAKYFGILDDDDALHPNHIASLVTILEKFDNCGLAYSGAIRIWEADESLGQEQPFQSEFNSEVAELKYFSPFNLFEFLELRNSITSNSFLARTSLLDPILKQDPQLDIFEDFFLLLNLSQRTNFIFSYQASSEFYHRLSRKDNTEFKSLDHWNAASVRIERIMQNQEFLLQQTLGNFRVEAANFQSLENQLQFLHEMQVQLGQTQAQLGQTQLQLGQTQAQLEQAQAQILAMESSKFWQIRKSWFKLKNILGMPSNE